MYILAANTNGSAHDTTAQFLAFRLEELQNDCRKLTSELASTTSEREELRAQLSAVKTKLAETQEAYSRHVLEVEADFKNQRASVQEENLQERATSKAQFDRTLHEQEQKFRSQIDLLNGRVSELDAEARKLREAKYELDSRVSELSHRLGSTEGTNRSLEEECSRLRALNTQLSSDKHERDVALNEARAKLGALEEKCSAQAEMAEQQRQRAKELETSLRQVEGRCGDLRKVVDDQEARLKDAHAEIVRGSQAIDKLAVSCFRPAFFRRSSISMLLGLS
eukprot:365431-Chlamydomonas_euryale.AAC.22